VLVIFAAILLALIAAAPEIGVLFTVISLPFLSFFDNPTWILCALVNLTFIFYVIKLLRGKRVFRLELVDAFVLLFAALIFLSSFFSAGGESSLRTAIVAVTLLLGYFLVVNLMRTMRWVKRCVIGLVASAAIVSAIGILEYFFSAGTSDSSWLDMSQFADIKMRVVSLFDNPNILSTFIVMIFPFVLALRCLSKRKNEKLLSFMTIVIMVVCTVFTWSRGSWLAMIVCSALFFIMYNQKFFRIFGVALLLVPALPLILPETVINRLLSISNLSDSSVAYRIYAWKGTMEAIQDNWLGGIGFGNEAFRHVYPKYAYSGIESAQHSHSLFLQIFLALGIVGIIIFAIVIFLCFQKMFEYIKAPEDKESKIYTLAVIASMVASLIMGVFDYIWYNYRVMYAFWIIIAIGCAAVRVGNYERNRKKEIEDYEQIQGKDKTVYE
jgi:oligosaccharide repeat unit polymerase